MYYNVYFVMVLVSMVSNYQVICCCKPTWGIYNGFEIYMRAFMIVDT